APLGPMSPSTSPGRTENDTSSSATKAPKVFVSRLTLRSVSAAGWPSFMAVKPVHFMKWDLELPVVGDRRGEIAEERGRSRGRPRPARNSRVNEFRTVRPSPSYTVAIPADVTEE